MITRTTTCPSSDLTTLPHEVVAEVQTPDRTGTGVDHGKEEAIAAAEADLQKEEQEDDTAKTEAAL